jgi:hypothetical protein
MYRLTMRAAPCSGMSMHHCTDHARGKGTGRARSPVLMGEGQGVAQFAITGIIPKDKPDHVSLGGR